MKFNLNVLDSMPKIMPLAAEKKNRLLKETSSVHNLEQFKRNFNKITGLE